MALRSGQLQRLIVDFFFPPRCISCGREGDFLCGECCKKIPRIVAPFCDKCGTPETSGALCPSCWKWRSKIDGIRSPFRFDGIIRQAIHELKYRNLRAISGFLAEFLFSYLQITSVPGEILVPVPLYPKRLRQRGYNQSSLIAEQLGRLAALPVAEDCLLRLKDGTPQARTATVGDRQRNVAGAFVCRDQRLNGIQVMLIDDVCTSGATLEACAVALKEAGAVSVWGLTLARET